MSPINREILKIDPDAVVNKEQNSLSNFLKVKSPSEENIQETPPILSFTRKREVEIDWNGIIDNPDDPGSNSPDSHTTRNPSIRAIRKYFEESWRFSSDFPDKTLQDSPEILINGSEPDRPAVIKELKEASDDGKQAAVYGYRKNKDDKDTLNTGFVIQHLESGRWYLLNTNAATQLSLDDFKSAQSYYEVWNSKVIGVELVVIEENDVDKYATEYEEIDLKPRVIAQKYNELSILKTIYGDVDSDLDIKTIIDDKLKSDSDLDIEKINELARRVLNVKTIQSKIDVQINQLKSEASRLGYLLCTDASEKSPDDKPLTPGKLYIKSKRIARWAVRHTRQVAQVVYYKVKHWFRSTTKKRLEYHSEDYIEYKSEPIDTYLEFNPSQDFLVQKQEEYNKRGLKESFIFTKSLNGFVDKVGMSLQSVMNRCQYDEMFRRNCVVLLPVYEESLTGEQLVIKYCVFIRPLPGITPTTLPSLSLQESLSYRMAWQGTQLGEFANSLSLAPGEERTIVIYQEFQQKTSQAVASNSIFDLNQSETTDLSNEIDNTVRREKAHTNNLQFQVKASVGWGPFGGEANSSGGTTNSLQDASESLAKTIQQAARSTNQQNRQEVSSSSTSEMLVNSRNESTATIRNVNQGRTLNLMFYHVYNKYRAGLYFHDLQFHVIDSVEVIAGSGVYDSKVYSLCQADEMMDDFAEQSLPFNTNLDEGLYQDKLAEAINQVLESEYIAESGNDDNPNGKNLNLLSISEPLAQNTQVSWSSYSQSLKKINIKRNQLLSEPQILLLLSKGLYLDALVGEQPATEPYSEKMRGQELDMRAAEVYVKNSEGGFREAQAKRLDNLGNAVS